MAMCYNRATERELMDILACPVCKGDVELAVDQENETEIATGGQVLHRLQRPQSDNGNGSQVRCRRTKHSAPVLVRVRRSARC